MDGNTQGVYLSAEGISKRFGGVQALNGARLHCGKGETHVLIGENGAGKSTLVKILCGVVKKDSGTITIGGKPAEINSAAQAEQNRIAAVFQELSLIPELSIAENIFLAREPLSRFGRVDFKRMRREAGEFLRGLGFETDTRTLVRDLSLCDKQVVEIAKALFKKPEILILDEATSALGDKEVKWLFERVRHFTRKENNTVIFISHRMDELRQIADKATIFRDSEYIMTFNWGELTDDEIVSYVSGKAKSEAAVKRNAPATDEAVLKVSGACRQGALNNVSFELKKGEILGIAGLSGHGQVELLHTLFGDGKLDAGSIELNGRRITVRNEREALKNGIALVPEDRKNEGLILSRPVGENITMMALNRLNKLGVLIGAKEKEAIERSIQKLSIKTDGAKTRTDGLSGGNQQKVVISKALLTNARVLLLSDPTRGIDIGTKNEIYKLMNTLTDEGISIIFFSTEMTELIQLCSRVLVFYEGGIKAELKGGEITEENIIAAAICAGGGVYEKQRNKAVCEAI